VCLSAVEYADKCCRDSQGNPWPPVPTDVSRDSYTIHELSEADVPSLEDLELTRGMPFREDHYPPFPEKSWKATSVICARWDQTTTEGALREWLDHHRCRPLRLCYFPRCAMHGVLEMTAYMHVQHACCNHVHFEMLS
jgi:hypothetical protein